MLKLLKYEFKKIFKSKFNLFIVFFAFSVCTYVIMDQLNGMYMSDVYEYINFEGKQMNSKEMIIYIDTFWHEHAGVLNDDFLDEIQNLKQSIIHEHEMDVLDEEAMIRYYGEDYKELDMALRNQEVSSEEINKLDQQLVAFYHPTSGGSYADIDTPQILYFEDGAHALKPIYKNMKMYRLLNYLFQNENEFEMLVHRESYLIDKKENLKMGFLENRFTDQIELTPKMIEKGNEKFLNNPYTFDSTVGADLIVYFLSGSNVTLIYVTLLILCLILTSNLFAIEHTSDTEQFLISSVKNKQVILAKITTSILIAIGIYIIYLIELYSIVNARVPIRNLNIVCTESFVQFMSTYKEVIGIALWMLISSSLATAALSSFLSCFTKSRFITSLILIVGMLMLELFWPYTILNMLNPFKMTYVYFYQGFNFVEVNGHVIRQSTLICSVWLVINILLYLSIYFWKKRTRLKNG